MDPRVQFTKRTDGVRIAYTVYGSGEPLIFPAGWISNLSYEDPSVKKFFGRLAKQFTVIGYDKHGCGLSDRDRASFTLEAELYDLDTIIEHLQVEKFNLFGISAAGPVSVAYTTLHSERVKNLILYGTYSDGKRVVAEEVQSALISLVRSAWGLGSKTLAEIFMPHQGPEVVRRFVKLQRESCSPETAANLLQLTYQLDVAEHLSRIRVPTLVLHRKDDKVMPSRLGRELAMGIPNSVFKLLEGDLHFPWLGDSSKVLEEILQFTGKTDLGLSVEEILARGEECMKPPRVDITDEKIESAEQATIVFSDIVSSTDLVTRLGDSAAKEVFLRHDRIVRDQVRKHRGRELQNLGDGFMLSFPSASSAMKCACDIQTALAKELPAIKVRMGINSGEVVAREGDHPFGQAIVLASRIASKAIGEQILVSDVTKLLVAGSGMPLLERGRVRLRGFSGSHKLFELDWKGR